MSTLLSTRHWVFRRVRRHGHDQHTTGSSPTSIDISPSDFVSLVLPVYKAMFANVDLLGSRGREESIRALTTPMHYTSMSFIRLLALAGRQLRLDTRHFEAALKAMIVGSGLIMASNMMQEQVSFVRSLIGIVGSDVNSVVC